MEFWDIYDSNRRLLGIRLERGAPLKRGHFHISVFVWVFNSSGEVLLTKRSPEKLSFPNQWALTGGAVVAGENSLQAVRRELLEETGISADIDEFISIDTFVRRNNFCDIYFLKKDVPLDALVLQEGETCDAIWVSRTVFEQMSAQSLIARPDAKRYLELGAKLDGWFK